MPPIDIFILTILLSIVLSALVQYLQTKYQTSPQMATSIKAEFKKNEELISQVKKSKVPVPWCEEFENMISGVNFNGAHFPPHMREHKYAVMKKLKRYNDSNTAEDMRLDTLYEERNDMLRICLEGVSIFDDASVTIGDRVIIGPDTIICSGTHDLDPAVRKEIDGAHALPIVIEDDCWIGARVVIFAGVRIGEGSMVAAGAVVTRDVPEGGVVGGVPAKVMKKVTV